MMWEAHLQVLLLSLFHFMGWKWRSVTWRQY